MKKITIVSFLVCMLYGLHKASKATTFQFFGEIIPRVETDQKIICLTYDDGPSENYTPRLLQLLDRFQAKATFFMTGKNIEKHPEIARNVLAHNHEIANHSYSHPKMVLKSFKFLNEEISKTDQLIRGLGVEGEINFRAPFGRKLFILPWILSSLDKKNIMWDVEPDPGDYLSPPAEEIYQDIIRDVRPGSIIVLHDGGGKREETLKATEMVLKDLSKQGFKFVTVKDLLKQKKKVRL